MPREFSVLADDEKLLRVIVNGTQNAIQAMGDEGVLIYLQFIQYAQ